MPKMTDSPTRFCFTQKILEAWPPHAADSPSAQLELCDAQCVGLRFNVTKTGRKFWFLRYRWRNRKKAIRLGEFPALNLKQARERAWELKGMIGKGEDPTEVRQAKADVPTFGKYAEEQYLPHARATVRRPDVIVSRLNTGVLPYFGDKPLDGITTRLVQQFHTAMKERTSATTANHHLILLKRMLNLAVQWGLIEKNPCVGVKKFQEPQGRDRYLAKDEVKRFLAALDECENIPVASGLRTLLFSGLRSREVFALRWEDVDEETKSIHLRQTKSGKSRRVYLCSAAWAEIERMRELRKGDHPFVFPGRMPNTPVMQPQRAFAAVLEAAKIVNFRIHDLRHTFASHMVQSGATLFEVQKSLGHASSQMTQRYSHLADSTLRDRAEVAAQRLTGAA